MQGVNNEAIGDVGGTAPALNVASSGGNDADGEGDAVGEDDGGEDDAVSAAGTPMGGAAGANANKKKKKRKGKK